MAADSSPGWAKGLFVTGDYIRKHTGISTNRTPPLQEVFQFEIKENKIYIFKHSRLLRSVDTFEESSTLMNLDMHIQNRY